MTGYTGPLVENNLSFEQFVWLCVRAMGVAAEMRDEGLDVPVPKEFSTSSFYRDRLKSCHEEADRLRDMKPSEREAYGKSLRDEAIKDAEESQAKNRRENKIMADMLAKVTAWKPPTSDHQGLKKFMVDQLTESIKFNDMSGFDFVKTAKEKTPLGYWEDAYASKMRMAANYVEEKQKEDNRVGGKNKWLADLRASVPQPARIE